jgi:hypothetical protein
MGAKVQRSFAPAPTPRTANVHPRCGSPPRLAGEWAESRSSGWNYAFADSAFAGVDAIEAVAGDVVFVPTGYRFFTMIVNF